MRFFPIEGWPPEQRELIEGSPGIDAILVRNGVGDQRTVYFILTLHFQRMSWILEK